MKVDKELQEAIAKHGELKVPKPYEEEFFDRVKNKRREIALSAS
jgi:hypothetical protein